MNNFTNGHGKWETVFTGNGKWKTACTGNGKWESGFIGHGKWELDLLRIRSKFSPPRFARRKNTNQNFFEHSGNLKNGKAPTCPIGPISY